MLKYNIEYSHIYVDEVLGEEHFLSMNRFRQLAKTLKRTDYTTVILIDDYNPHRKVLDESHFLLTLRKLESSPDYICHESQLSMLKERFEQSLLNRERKGLEKYVEVNGKIPCSFLIAMWNLLRLGAFDEKWESIVKRQNAHVKTFVAENTITILPRKYAPVEARAIRYIEHSSFKSYAKSIKHYFV